MGLPALSGDSLLITGEDGHVRGVQLADGAPLWELQVATDVGPSAAAVPLDTNRILIALHDGTLLPVAIPRKPAKLAETLP